MSQLRFSVAGLLGLVFLTAVCFAAMRSASGPWVLSLTFSLTLCVLLFALLGAIFGKGQTRLFWTAFALFGWTYVICVFGPWFESQVKPYLATTRLLKLLHPWVYRTVDPFTVSERGTVVVWVRAGNAIWVDGELVKDEEDAVRRVAEVLEGGQKSKVVVFTDYILDPNLFSQAHNQANDVGNAIMLQRSIKPEWNYTRPLPEEGDFQRVGHSLLALLIAFLAGSLARYRFARPGSETGRSPCSQS